MLSEGSPNVNRPACGKKIRKINKQFLYHRDPMCNLLSPKKIPDQAIQNVWPCPAIYFN